MAIYRLGEQVPRISANAYVHESATVVGNVVLEDRVSIWPQAVIRGDTATIRIGARSNVQDGSVLHVDEGIPLTIGEDVTIGHQVMLHGCTIGDGSLIGMQAIVLNGAIIGNGCLVGAGTLVSEGKSFPAHMMILGSPARVIRELQPEHVERMRRAAAHYIDEAMRYRQHAVRIDVEGTHR